MDSLDKFRNLPLKELEELAYALQIDYDPYERKYEKRCLKGDRMVDNKS